MIAGVGSGKRIKRCEVTSKKVRRCLWLVLVVSSLILSPVVATAVEDTGAAESGQPATAAEGTSAVGGGQPMDAAPGPGEPDYKPTEYRANDSSMALLFGTVFGVPIGAWFIIRSLKPKKRKKTA
jgi:hypothetical protein